MSAKRSNPAPFPSRDQILEFVRDSPSNVGKREIARAFHLDAEQKRVLKKVLREMALDGSLKRGAGRRFSTADKLPPVAVLEVIGPDSDGDLMARPMNWDLETEPPAILVDEERGRGAALGAGDRVLARLREDPSGGYRAKTIRRVSAAPTQVIGIFNLVDGEPRIRPTDRRNKFELVVRTGDTLGANPGELVRAEVMPGKRLGLRQAKITERLDPMDKPGSISMIAIHDRDIPVEFPIEAMEIASKAGPATMESREDLRDVPLVTIDGADARDFDDAVWAEPDADAGNQGGWRIIVAIADVAWYVRPESALDRAARKRGNSVYFPDRVVPMLPEELSNGWCSLVPGEDRPCLAAHMWIDRHGHLIRHRFERAMMRSAARLTYEQVQAARDGEPDETTSALLEPVITPLYGAYEALAENRRQRNTIELDIPERRIELSEAGDVVAVNERQRLTSHQVIEEFMIAANVAAAETLEKVKRPCMYRVHDQPSVEKIEALADFLDTIGLRFARGQVVKPIQFNQILKKVEGSPEAHMVNQIILRSQSQAEYSPENIGHFGLALRKYCHFTSPIRRYSDLLVHRALISGCRLGAGGLGADEIDWESTGEHISMTERRAASAERDAVDRYTASFLASRVGAVFSGRVNGVTRFGLFVTLDDTGADGLVPVSSLPDDYYVLDDRRHSLVGDYTGAEYRLGQPVEVRLKEAMPITGGLIFSIMDSGTAGRGSTRTRKSRKASGLRRGNHRKKARKR